MSISMIALSMPIPVKADIRCSMVFTGTSPQEIVVLLAVLETLVAIGSTRVDFPPKELLKRIPESAGAGFTVILDRVPV